MPEDKAFEEANPHFKEFLRGLHVWNSEESGRGVVLVASAMLDDILERCIRAFLVESNEIDKLLTDFNGPLGSLSARILAAYSLGLLSKEEYEECHRLRKIRNLFAHNVHTSFADQKVVDLCANLNLHVKQSDETRKHPRAKFEIAAMGVIIFLTEREKHLAGRRLKFGDWRL